MSLFAMSRMVPPRICDAAPEVERLVSHQEVVLRVPVPPAYESTSIGAERYLLGSVSPRPRGLDRRIRRAETKLLETWTAMHRAAGALDEHEFAGDDADCEVCGEGRLHYLHPSASDANHSTEA